MKVDPETTIIFDLDGTLVDSHDFDAKLYVETVREVIGDLPVDDTWERYEHVTDPGILVALLNEAGLRADGSIRARFRECFGAKVSEYFSNGGECRAIPGAGRVLEKLIATGCRVGIATGGWGHTARMKLASAGISREGVVLTSGDDSHRRLEIMTLCLARLGGNSKNPVYVGDGIWDVRASREAGWGFIGVGPRLKGRCENWISDFRDDRRLASSLAKALSGGDKRQ